MTFHSGDVVTACLEGLATFAPELNPVIVVDNASADATVQRAQQWSEQRSEQRAQQHDPRSRVRVIANQQNQGFAGGANQGIAAALEAGADAVLLLNPDVRLTSALGDLASQAIQNGLSAGRLTDENGRTQAGFTIRRLPGPTVLALELLGINRLWPGNPWNVQYRCLDLDLAQPAWVEQPAGALLMIGGEVWRKLGGLDERFYPVWFEDVDFCKRAIQAGYRIRYAPRVTAQHIGGHSIGKLSKTTKEVYWYDSLVKYSTKHFEPWSYRVVCLAAMLSVVPRTVFSIIRERSLRPITTSFKVLNLVGRRLVSVARPTQWLGRDTNT